MDVNIPLNSNSDDDSTLSEFDENCYTCDVCQKQFSSNGPLILHRASHELEQSFACKLCEEKFLNADDLSKHSKDEKSACSKNSKKLIMNKVESLARQQLKHSLLPEIFSCTICDKPFSSDTDMTKHRKLHFCKSFQCKVCSIFVNSKSKLKSHEKIHSFDYECRICSQRFTEKVNLQRHYLIHTNSKPYFCHLCRKSFTDQSILSAHILEHKGSKIYNCLVCDKIFTNQHLFKQHGLEHLAK
ncbi:hypothetical protein TNCT_287091 [Trichonephila clavata]|uniref:C2H2-type domain-containing protein n=1 Tax=Trichonephila clavata TaxID=2740835 RepID=A0A8X6LPM4_TRICU|nr:hypothetical protein TNCT_287091 [Trichonephila clavata]